MAELEQLSTDLDNMPIPHWDDHVTIATFGATALTHLHPLAHLDSRLQQAYDLIVEASQESGKIVTEGMQRWVEPHLKR